jgi:hypothetical protein
LSSSCSFSLSVNQLGSSSSPANNKQTHINTNSLLEMHTICSHLDHFQDYCCLLLNFSSNIILSISQLFEARPIFRPQLPVTGRFWQKHPPLIRQHRHLPLTKCTKTELQRIDTPVPVPEPACRCQLERTDDHQIYNGNRNL